MPQSRGGGQQGIGRSGGKQGARAVGRPEAAYDARVDLNCLFCRIASGDVPTTVVRETDSTLAFRDINPKAPVHILIIPKEHYADVATLAQNDSRLAARVLETAAIVAETEGLLADGFRLIFNTGDNGGQEVQHAHAHLLGGAPLGPMLAR
jgi:histidine triad (HIT) family protein